MADWFVSVLCHINTTVIYGWFLLLLLFPLAIPPLVTLKAPLTITPPPLSLSNRPSSHNSQRRVVQGCQAFTAYICFIGDYVTNKHKNVFYKYVKV
jgi:hypothetical protein